mmetsp:Transcript_104810/g.254372  ORF Transcript_104810/g.254372 Transcript_104810/m.254372 type:complete len:89 (-) Transcript_104810:31-297(-)
MLRPAMVIAPPRLVAGLEDVAVVAGDKKPWVALATARCTGTCWFTAPGDTKATPPRVAAVAKPPTISFEERSMALYVQTHRRVHPHQQ